jgi:formylglycine-generating enzyme required for sulfatase activity/tRNA A-37 threonylcarbamoyl transferase component Bud32
MTNLTGETISNRYRVDSFIGRGGMADVYKIWDAKMLSFLAMKVLYQDLSTDKIFLRRFKREAQTLSKLQHPSIVRFYGFEQEGRLAFILMDFIEGESLKLKIFDAIEPFSIEEIRGVIRPVLGALQFAHNMGMVHCDIKPGNVMIDNSGRVLVTDFGIARMTDAATATMVGMGTPAYMAPEQVRGIDPTPQTDIYAMGIVLYEMLTCGERPFTGEQATITGTTSEKVRWEQMNLRAPSPTRWNPKISPELEGVLYKSLEKDPKNRYDSALALLNALEMATSETPLVVEQASNVSVLQELEVDDNKIVSEPAIDSAQPVASTHTPWWQRWYLWATLGLLGIIAVLAWPRNPETVVEVVVETVLVTALPVVVNEETSTQTPIISTPIAANPEIGSTMVSPKDGMVMVYVPKGEFTMGNNNGSSDEKPIHNVYLDSYWIDQTEVTNAMFATFLNELGNQREGEEPWFDATYNGFITLNNNEWQPVNGFENHPIAEVTWYGARAYCDWAGRQLPTEAQWEKAARSNDVRDYPWGNDFACSRGNFDDETYFDTYVVPGGAGCDGYDRTSPVGSFPDGSSPYGALDMAGNVWEWVADWYDKNSYNNTPMENPQGPATGEYRLLRGGSWVNGERLISSTNRNRVHPTISLDNYGFRCSLSP